MCKIHEMVMLAAFLSFFYRQHAQMNWSGRRVKYKLSFISTSYGNMQNIACHLSIDNNCQIIIFRLTMQKQLLERKTKTSIFIIFNEQKIIMSKPSYCWNLNAIKTDEKKTGEFFFSVDCSQALPQFHTCLSQWS